MEITEVRIKLVENTTERLRAFCSITLDGDFVIRDLKIIDGSNGAFVAMPSRKLMDRCSRCGSKNHLRSRFCNECGGRLNENRAPKDPHGRAKLHADVAHPINAACRERVQQAVVEAYHEELEHAKSPDYKPARYDDYEDYEDELSEPKESPASRASVAPPSRPTAPAPKREEPTRESTSKGDDQFGDYNELIADLKRDAQNRQRERREQDMRNSSYSGNDMRGGFGSPAEDDRSDFVAPLDEDDVSSMPSAPEPDESLRSTLPEPDIEPADDGDDFGAGL